MCEQNHYFEILRKSPQGFAHHEVITDKEGKTVDYVFLEVNEAFEKLTGLKAKDIINKKVTEVIPGIEKNAFDWIAFYGNVAMKGLEEEYEQFSAPLNRWYKGYAFSSRKGYFTTMFSDITPDRLISEASRKFMEHAPNTIDYKYITNTMKAISGATFVAMNRFEPDGKDFTTVAIAGHSKSIEDAAKVMGFSLSEKKWKYDPQREARIRNEKTTIFSCLGGLTGNAIPKNIVRLIETTFNTGECAIVKTSKGKTIIGDFTLIYQKGQKVRNQAQLEIYADMVGMLFTAREADRKSTAMVERFSMAQAFAGIGGWEYKIRTSELFWTKECEKLFGLEEGGFRGTFEHFMELVHPDDREYVISMNRPITEGSKGIPLEYEHRIIRPCGGVRWVRETAVVIYKKTGEPSLVSGFVMDITERKTAEHTLKTNQQQLEMFFSQSLHGFFVCMLDEPIEWNNDTDKEKMLEYALDHQRMTKVNQAMLDQYGATEEDFIGITVKELFRHDVDHAREIWRGLFDKGKWHVETREQKMDGTPIIIDGDYICLYDEQGRITGHFGVQVDVTAQKVAEKALQDSEARYSAFENNAEYITQIITSNGKTSYISRQVTDILGYTQDEIFQMESVFEYIHPDSVDYFTVELQKLLTGKEKTSNAEYRYKHKNGHWVWLEVSATNMMDDPLIKGLFLSVKDIAGRKQAEEKLRQSEERYKHISEQAPVGMFQFRLSPEGEGSFTYASPGIRNILGVDEEVIKKNWLELHNRIHPDHLSTFEDSMRVSALELSRFDVTFLFSSAERGEIWLQTKSDPQRFEDGSTLWTGVFIDVDREKRAEEFLKTEKLRLQNIIAGTNAGTWECNLASGETILNENWANVLGYKLEEITPATVDVWVSNLHPDDRAEANTILEKHIKGELEYYEHEARMKHKQGHYVWVFGKGKIISWTKDGKPEWMFGTHQDITGRKQAEEEIKKAREQYRSLVENIPGVTYRCKFDKDWTMLFMSEAVDPLSGYPASDFINNALRSYESIIHPEDTEMVSQRIQAAVAEKMAWDIDYRLFIKSGNIRWVHEKGRAVFDEDGSVACLDGFILDISEKKEAEFLKQFQLEFQQIVAEASSRFVGIESDEAFDDVLNDCLLRLGKLFGVDRSYLFMFSDDLERMTNTHEWCATGISKQMNRIQDAATDSLPWWRKQIMQAKTVHVPDVNALPPEAKAEKEEFRPQGIQSLISLPMQSASGKMMGFFGFDTVNKPYRWPSEQIVMLQLVADTIGGAIERRRFHQSIVEKNTQLRQIMDLVPGYIFAKDIDGRFLLANKAVADVFGTTTDEIAGKTDKDYGATDEQMEAYSRDDREVIESGRPKLIPEEQIIRKDGSLGWFQTVKIPYKHPGWDKPAILGVGTDITERKQAEEIILENEQRFNLAISGTGAGLWDWDMVKDTVYFSPYWKEMLGYDDHEVENHFMGWKNLWHPDDAGKIEQAISDHLAGKTKKYEVEHRLKHKDGSWHWILTRGDIIKDKNGTPLRWVGTNIDLTENKKLSLEVERQSSLISSLLDSIPDIIFFKDKHGVYLGCNPPFAEFVGRPREEIVGHTDYDLFSKEIADFFRKHDKKMLEQMEKRHNEEWITYPDGRTILIDTLKTPYYGPGGKLIGILGISRDITDRKKAEEAIIRAREQAQAASKAKSEFLANMSHEIRTPLNGVIGFTELLKNTRLTKLQQQYLENANTSAHMLLGIISDILDLSKIESGKFELDPVKTDIIELTGQAIDIVKYKASEKGLEMLLNIQHGMPRFAVVDPIRLKQVLVNLLGNAVKFTEKGEIELRVEFTGINQKRGSFHFSVRDTGIGIEKSKQEQLFDAFFQADTSSTRRFGGTGLGLQISKLLIDKMKGNIGVESEYGKGSTFFFEIETKFETGEKADKMSVAAIERTLVTDLNNITNPVFLVVEDVFLNMELMKAVLQEILPNAVIHEASNGQEALDIVVSKPKIDLIFMDVQMPVMDGLEATRQIRAYEKEFGKSTPIIALTAGVVRGEKEKCLEAGMDDFLAKPLNQLFLRDKIQIYIDTESTKAENAEHSPVIIEKHFDIAGVIERSGINHLLVIEIASKSLTSIGNYLPNLKAAIKSSASEEREQIAHTLKGISLNMGFTTMGILAEKLEMMENDNTTSQYELHDAMCKELNLLIQLVKQHETPKQSKEPLDN